MSNDKWGWKLFLTDKPEHLEIVAVIDENGEADFGIYQARWEWVSCVNERVLKPVYWCSLPPLPQPPK